MSNGTQWICFYGLFIWLYGCWAWLPITKSDMIPSWYPSGGWFAIEASEYIPWIMQTYLCCVLLSLYHQFLAINVINCPISFRVASLALGQSYCPSVCEATLKDMGKIGSVPYHNEILWYTYHAHNFVDILYFSGTNSRALFKIKLESWQHRNPIMDIWQLQKCLILIIGNPTEIRKHFYIETATSYPHSIYNIFGDHCQKYTTHDLTNNFKDVIS